MRVTLKAIHDELQRVGHDVRLEKADGYFYFRSGETSDWLDRTVKVPMLSSLTLYQWVEEFNKLKNLNQELLRGNAPQKSKQASPAPSRKRRQKV